MTTNRNRKKAAAAILVATAAVLLLFGACKGRTMQNMEPTGDTVEVEIVPAATDTVTTDTINY